MEYEVTFADGIAELRCYKEFAFEDGLEALSEVAGAPWLSEMRALLILDEGSAFSPTRDGIRQLKVVMDRILSDERVRIAIVVARIVHYGIGRVLEARVDEGSGRVRVFLKEDAARQWLDASSR
jgi:hypothetical protein